MSRGIKRLLLALGIFALVRVLLLGLLFLALPPAAENAIGYGVLALAVVWYFRRWRRERVRDGQKSAAGEPAR